MVIAKTGINVAHFLEFTVFDTCIPDPYSAIFKIDQGKFFHLFALFNQNLEEMSSKLILNVSSEI